MRTGAGKADAICTLSNRTDDFFCVRTEEAEFVIRTFDALSLNYCVIEFVGMADFFDRRFTQSDVGFADSGNFAFAVFFLEINYIRQSTLFFAIGCNT